MTKKIIRVLILLASHNGEDIRILCDAVYRMEKGRILSGGETGLKKT